MKFYAQTVPGIEEIAWLEIRSQLANANFEQYLFAKDRNGIVSFGYEGPISPLFRLRTVEDIFWQTLSVAKLSRGRQDLRYVHGLIWKGEAFGRAANQFLRYRKFSSPPTYSVVCRKYGRHQYRRKEIEQAALDALVKRYPRWTPVTENPQVEIWVNLLGSHLLCGVRLSDERMGQRYEEWEEPEATLRPSVAAAMVHLTSPAPADVFMDPLCGSGILLAERRAAQAYRLLLGGDLLAAHALAARHNLLGLRRHRRSKSIYTCQWEAGFLPLPAAAIDKIATRFPAGSQMESLPALERAYAAFMLEIGRVLKPNGRAIVFSHQYERLKEATRQQPHLEITTGYSLLVAGQWGRIYIIEQSA